MQVADVLDAGAAAVVVSRIHDGSAVKRYAVVHLGGVVVAPETNEVVYESPLYPVFEVEGFAHGFLVAGGRMIGLDGVSDGFSSGFLVTGGGLELSLMTISEMDGIAHGFSVTGGSFPSQLYEVNNETDYILQAFTVTGGSFPNALITTVFEPDYFSQGFSITGGTMT